MKNKKGALKLLFTNYYSHTKLILPQIKFPIHQRFLYTLGFVQLIYTLGVILDAFILIVGLFYNVTGEHSFHENIVKAQVGRVAVFIHYLFGSQYRAGIGEIYPESGLIIQFKRT